MDNVTPLRGMTITEFPIRNHDPEVIEISNQHLKYPEMRDTIQSIEDLKAQIFASGAQDSLSPEEVKKLMQTLDQMQQQICTDQQNTAHKIRGD